MVVCIWVCANVFVIINQQVYLSEMAIKNENLAIKEKLQEIYIYKSNKLL